MANATFSQLVKVANDPNFQTRVKLALLSTALAVYSEASGSAVFTGSISTTTLTVATLTSGVILPGQTLTSTTIGTVTAGTTISAQVSGTVGGVGSYTVNNSQTVSSQTLDTNGVTNHSARAAFATKVLTNQAGTFDLFTISLMILTGTTIDAETALGTLPDYGIPDGDLSNGASAAWNALAGA